MYVVIDRIEGKIAVLELPKRGGTIDIPVKFLPKGVKEGNILEMNFSINTEQEEKQKKKVKDLQKKLKKKK